MNTIKSATQIQSYRFDGTISTPEKTEARLFHCNSSKTLKNFQAKEQYHGKSGKTYQMTAEYADYATEIVPVVKVTVTSELGNAKEYFIDITKVDTSRATEIEMFALCSHADTKRRNYGDITENTLSSWESLLFYRDMAAKQETPNTTPEKEVYNWRDMIYDSKEIYTKETADNKYLPAQRMKDMLDYYSHFDGRPDAFEDTFHAIRDYEFIRVLSLDDGTNIEIYDKQRKILCKNINLKPGNNVIWCRELTEEELLQAIEIAGSPNKAYMKEYSFWDSLLSKKSRPEDYNTYIQELKRQYLNDTMFASCPHQVKEAFKQAEKSVNFPALGLEYAINSNPKNTEKNLEVKFISEYMLMLTEHMKKGKDLNLLGHTKESAIELAMRFITRLEENNFKQLTTQEKQLKLKEKSFYYHFLHYLSPTPENNPVQILLKG